MALTAGTRLGPYEILGGLGAGGMGEVYKARDTRLERTVAIKVLPAHLASDPQFRERFDREARAISALDHPHICALYDIGRLRAEGASASQGDEIDFLVMQFLEGQTLAEKLERGPLPLDRALKTATEIASALDSAHRAGIVHRDLKPGNIMVTRTGAKLLDFGLAKSAAPVITSGNSSMPTTAAPLTARGTILGTFQYMAPEQLQGQEADARTDIFAFGAVLYEMLTGKKAFEGKSQASLIGAILHADPSPIATVQPLTPSALERVVRKCLAKDPDDRWQTSRDLLDELRWIESEGGAATVQSGSIAGTTGRPRTLIGIVLAGVVAGSALGSLFLWSFMRPASSTPPQVTRSYLGVAPADQLLGADPGERNRYPVRPSRTAIALSPDGRRLVFSALRGQTQQMYLKDFDRLEATPIPGTEDSEGPFFSPDGQYVGFWKAGELKKVPVSGGPPVSICRTPRVYGASWGDNNIIVFARQREGLSQVSGDGGSPQPLTTLDVQQGDFSHRLPHFVPDGKAVVFTIQKALLRWDTAQIAVLSLETGVLTRLNLEGGADARYVPTGHLVYALNGSLMAVPFDLARLTATGGAVGMLDSVMQNVNAPPIDAGAAQFDVAENGTMVYVRGGIFPDQPRELVWVDREGAVTPLASPTRIFAPHVRLSPDGQKLGVFTQGTDRRVWTYNLASGTLTPMPFEGPTAVPVWTPDGKKIVFESSTTGAPNLFWKAPEDNGAAEALTTSQYSQRAGSISRDNILAFTQNEPATTGLDIWTLSLNDPAHKTERLLGSKKNEQSPDFSPDGRWIAYASDESGRSEIYVQPYPLGQGHPVQVSAEGGSQAVWSRNRSELFYTLPDEGAQRLKMMVAEIVLTPTFRVVRSRPLGSVVRIGTPSRGYDVSLDGRRFITVQDTKSAPEAPPSQMILVQSWFEELKRRVPTK